MAETKKFSLAEVSNHNTGDDCWVAIGGKVYDVTEFLEEHPGGIDEILTVSGSDATQDFERVGHSEDARKLLEKYYVGELETSIQAPLNVDNHEKKHVFEWGAEPEKKAFCRCWKSKNFPYCDGSHNKFNEETGSHIGPVVVTWAPPDVIPAPAVPDNRLNIAHHEKVHNVALGPEAETKAFCRCWKSQNFPYCDGSHNAYNKETGSHIGPAVVTWAPTDVCKRNEKSSICCGGECSKGWWIAAAAVAAVAVVGGIYYIRQRND